jgi:hypothetical protein
MAGESADSPSLEKRYLDSARRFAMAPIAANGAALALVLPELVTSPLSVFGIKIYLAIATVFSFGLVFAGISYFLEVVHLNLQVKKSQGANIKKRPGKKPRAGCANV